MLGDIRSPRWLYIKAVLLLLIGILASTLLMLDHPTLRTFALLVLAVWGFCRAYYFAFYVVQHYADPTYRFAGLWDFGKYVWRKRLAAKSQSESKIAESFTDSDYPP